MSKSQDVVKTVRNFVNGMHYTYLLHYGVKLGIFDEIKKLRGTFSVKELAGELGFVEWGIKRWCEVAYSIGILNLLNEDKYSIKDEWLEAVTDKSSKSYIRHLASCHLLITESFSQITDTLKTGSTFDYDSCSNDFIESVELDGVRFTNSFFDDILPKMSGVVERLESGGKILDIGCGSGQCLITLAKKFPKAHFIGVDVSKNSIIRAQNNAKKEGLESRIRFVSDCASTLSLDDKVDAVMFIESLHEINSKVRPALFKNCNNLLRDDGSLMIIDFVAPESVADLNEDEYKMAALVNWFELTWGSSTFTKKEISQLLRTSGFSELEVIQMSDSTIAGTAKKLTLDKVV